MALGASSEKDVSTNRRVETSWPHSCLGEQGSGTAMRARVSVHAPGGLLPIAFAEGALVQLAERGGWKVVHEVDGLWRMDRPFLVPHQRYELRCGRGRLRSANNNGLHGFAPALIGDADNRDRSHSGVRSQDVFDLPCEHVEPPRDDH